MKKIYTIIAALFCCVALQAQGSTGYFVDKSTARHSLNPAFAPNQGFIGIPFLSGMSITTAGNLSMDKLLYPVSNGRLGTFLHPEVSTAQALGSLSDINDLRADLSYDIVNAGWYTDGNLFGTRHNFVTVDLSVKAVADGFISYQLFEMLKGGMTQDPDSRTIDDASRLTAAGYAQASVGLSMEVCDGFRVGAKAKLLGSLAGMDATLDNVHLIMGSEQWLAAFDLDIKNTRKVLSVGAAVDFGVEYKFTSSSALRGLSLSASVTDLGFLSSASGNYVNKVLSAEIDFQGLQMADSDTDIDSYIKWDSLEEIDESDFKDRKTEGPMRLGPAPKVYAGASYSLFNDVLRLGLLYNRRFCKILPTQSVTASCGVSPWRWFDLTVACSYTTGEGIEAHSAIGWLATIKTQKAVNLHFGSDYSFIKRNRQFIPVHTMYSDFRFGMSIPIKSYKRQ